MGIVCSFLFNSYCPVEVVHPSAVTCISTVPRGTSETLATPWESVGTVSSNASPSASDFTRTSAPTTGTDCLPPVTTTRSFVKLLFLLSTTRENVARGSKNIIPVQIKSALFRNCLLISRLLNKTISYHWSYVQHHTEWLL